MKMRRIDYADKKANKEIKKGDDKVKDKIKKIVPLVLCQDLDHIKMRDFS